MLGLQSRPYLQATRAVVEPDGEQRDEATIYLRPGQGVRRRAVRLAAGPAHPGGGHPTPHRDAAPDPPSAQPAVPAERLLDLLLRLTRQPGLHASCSATRTACAAPTTRPAPSWATGWSPRTARCTSPPSACVERAERLEADFAAVTADADRILLITQAPHQDPQLVDPQPRRHGQGRGRRHQPPVRAPRRRRRGSAWPTARCADVSTDVATVRLPVKLLDDLMPGTVRAAPRLGPPARHRPVGRVAGPRGRQREPAGRRRPRRTSTRPRACRT